MSELVTPMLDFRGDVKNAIECLPVTSAVIWTLLVVVFVMYGLTAKGVIG